MLSFKLLPTLLVASLSSLSCQVSASSILWPSDVDSSSDLAAAAFHPQYDLMSIAAEMSANEAAFAALTATGQAHPHSTGPNSGHFQQSSLPQPVLIESSSSAGAAAVYESSSTAPQQGQFEQSSGPQPVLSVSSSTAPSESQSSAAAPVSAVSSTAPCDGHQPECPVPTAAASSTAPQTGQQNLSTVTLVPQVEYNATECVMGQVPLLQLGLQTTAEDVTTLQNIYVTLSISGGATLTFNRVTGITFKQGGPSGFNDTEFYGPFDAVNQALHSIVLIEATPVNNGTVTYALTYAINPQESLIAIFQPTAGQLPIHVAAANNYSLQYVLPLRQCGYTVNETETIQIDGSYLNAALFTDRQQILKVKLHTDGAFLQLLTADGLVFEKVTKEELIFSGTVEKVNASLNRFSFTADVCGSVHHSTGYSITVLQPALNSTNGTCLPLVEQHCHIINLPLLQANVSVDNDNEAAESCVDDKNPEKPVFARVNVVVQHNVSIDQNEDDFFSQCDDDMSQAVAIADKRVQFYSHSSVDGTTQLYFKLLANDESQSSLKTVLSNLAGHSADNLTPAQLYSKLASQQVSFDNTKYLQYVDQNSWTQQCPDGNYKPVCSNSNKEASSTLVDSPSSPSVWSRHHWLMPLLIAVGGSLAVGLFCFSALCVYKRKKQHQHLKDQQRRDSMEAIQQTDSTGLQAKKQYIYNDAPSAEPTTVNHGLNDSFSDVTILGDQSVDPSRLSMEEQQLNEEPIVVHSEAEAQSMAKKQLQCQLPAGKKSQPSQQFVGGKHFIFTDDSVKESSSSSTSMSSTASVSTSSAYHFKFNNDVDHCSFNSQLSMPNVTVHSRQGSDLTLSPVSRSKSSNPSLNSTLKQKQALPVRKPIKN